MSATLLRHGRHSTAQGLVISTIFLVGCTTSNIDTALRPEPLPPAPQTAVERANLPAPIEPTRQTVVSQSTEPLAYPNINRDPVGETKQLSAADQQAIRDQTARAKQSVDAADESAAYAARLKILKHLAITHAIRTQDQIENQ